MHHLKIVTISRLEQFGFKAHHNTTTKFINVIDNITINYNKTAEVLLDIEKAFYKVWHNGFIYKLIQAGGSHHPVYIVRVYLKDRSFHVKIGDTISSFRKIQAGVLQGSSLLPQLFTIFIDDMPRHPQTKAALFAHDSLIYAMGPTNKCAMKRLQEHLDLLGPWFQD